MKSPNQFATADSKVEMDRLRIRRYLVTFGQLEKLHPRFAGIGAFYDNELGPLLRAREEKLNIKQTFKAYHRYEILFLPSLFLAVLFVWGFAHVYTFWGAMAGTVALVVGAIRLRPYDSKRIKKIRTLIKSDLMDGLCKFLNLTHMSSPSGLVLDPFTYGGLLPSFHEAELEDEIAGEIDGVPFRLFEATLQVREKKDGKEYRHTVFEGVLASFAFSKPVTGRTFVGRDKGVVGNVVGNIGAMGERARLEDPRFEERFQVFTTDQVEARYLLTPRFMERILDLDELLGGELQLAFSRNQLLVSVAEYGERFEPEVVLEYVDQPRAVARYLYEFVIIFQIIEALKLSTTSKS